MSSLTLTFVIRKQRAERFLPNLFLEKIQLVEHHNHGLASCGQRLQLAEQLQSVKHAIA